MGEILKVLKAPAVYDWLMIAYIIIGLIFLIIRNLKNDRIIGKISKEVEKDPYARQVNQVCDIDFIIHRNSWLKKQNVWMTVEHFFVGLSYLTIIGIIYMLMCNVITGEELFVMKMAVYALINLFSSIFRHYLKPRRRAIGARKAYLMLNKAILRYEDGLIRKENVIEMIDIGEKIMTRYVYEE